MVRVRVPRLSSDTMHSQPATEPSPPAAESCARPPAGGTRFFLSLISNALPLRGRCRACARLPCLNVGSAERALGFASAVVVALFFLSRLADSPEPHVHIWGRLALLLLSGCWLALLATGFAVISSIRLATKSPEGGEETVHAACYPDSPATQETGAPRDMLLLPARALAATALLGYLLFWIYLWSSALGHVLALASVVGAIALFFAPKTGSACRRLWLDRRWRISFSTTAALALLYFGLLHLWPHGGDWNWLAAHRYRDPLPMDNILPQLLAERLARGEPLEPFVGDWLSSDRPPLQAAWTLLAGPLLSPSSGLTVDGVGQSFGLWHQLLWWPVALALLQRLGLPLRRSLCAAMPLALTAFLFTNSTYVWPKLSAAAFVLLAWLELQRSQVSWARVGAWLALGFLSHGGAAFSIIALGPFLVRRITCGVPAASMSSLARVALVSAVFLTIASPWFAYQRWGAPPGNRLLKWHLAGAPQLDGRGTWETLRDAYASLPAGAWLRGRVDNVNALHEGSWSGLWTLSADTIDRRRSDDFFHLLRSLGWWNSALFLLLAWALKGVDRRKGILGTFAWKRRNEPPDRGNGESKPRSEAPDNGPREAFALLGWVVLTLACWVLLMFQPYTTVLHLGSSLPPLLLLILAAWALLRLHAAAFSVVACASVIYFADTYILHAPKDFSLPPSLPAAGLACLAAFALICAPLHVKALSDCR